MKKQASQTDWITDELVDDVRARLQSGKRVRRTLPDGGRLHIDRPLPFLCIYRKPLGGGDDGTSQLLEGEASFLIASASKRSAARLSGFVSKLVGALSMQFGAFLIVEIWAAPDGGKANDPAVKLGRERSHNLTHQMRRWQRRFRESFRARTGRDSAL